MCFLLFDAGSTKTNVVHYNNSVVDICTFKGINPVFQTNRQIEETLVLINKKFDVSKPQVFYYGAGCRLSENKARIKTLISKIFKAKEIFVFDDLLGAARAAYYDKSGIIAILGTGSNCGFYNGEILSQRIQSLGYIFGDEGSGAYLGKLFLNELLYNQLPKSIENAFNKKYNYSYDDIIRNVYKSKSPSAYLSQFTLFLFEHKNHKSVKVIINKGFNDFFSKMLLPLKIDSKNIAFGGSVAYHFQDELLITAKQFGYERCSYIQNPIEQLINFHSTK